MFPGFLPPSAAEQSPQHVDPDVRTFCDAHSPLIVANGKVAYWRGQDLYGFDQLILLTERLKSTFPNIGTVISFWDHLPSDQPRLNHLVATARAKGLEKNILFNTTPGLFVPILDLADVFVRPTVTDGDANSIREALYLGVPVVASDAVVRPPGTILFRTRDITDFADKTVQALRVKRQPISNTAISEQNTAVARSEAYLAFLSDLVRSAKSGRNRRAYSI